MYNTYKCIMYNTYKCICIYAFEYRCLWRPKEDTGSQLELELQVVVSPFPITWVLITKLWSPVRSIYTFKH